MMPARLQAIGLLMPAEQPVLKQPIPSSVGNHDRDWVSSSPLPAARPVRTIVFDLLAEASTSAVSPAP